MNDLLALVAAVTALCAVLLGPMVSMWAAGRQSRVAVLSANRQAWINSLRDLIAECMSTAALIQLADWSTRPQSEFEERMERLSFMISKIRLMLNPKEDDHQRLADLLGELMKACGGLKSTDPKNRAVGATAVQQLVPLSQSVLKREWERVKRLE